MIFFLNAQILWRCFYTVINSFWNNTGDLNYFQV